MRTVHLHPGRLRRSGAGAWTEPGDDAPDPVELDDDEPVGGITLRAWVDGSPVEPLSGSAPHGHAAGDHPAEDHGAEDHVTRGAETPGDAGRGGAVRGDAGRGGAGRRGARRRGADRGAPRAVTVRELRRVLTETADRGGFVWLAVRDADARAAEALQRVLDLPAKVVRDTGRGTGAGTGAAPGGSAGTGTAAGGSAAHGPASGPADGHRQVRPHLRVGSDFVSLVVKSTWYVDHPETRGVADIRDTGDCAVVLTDAWALTVRHGPTPDLDRLGRTVEGWTHAVEHGPSVVLAGVIACCTAAYGRVVDEVQVDLDELADEVFTAGGDPPVEKSYRLKRQLSTLRSATTPLAGPIARLADEDTPCVSDSARSLLREFGEQLDRVRGTVHDLDELLDSVNDAAQAQVSQQQNDDMRKISAWVAIAAVPTLLAGIYGMNFQHMPELGWRFGYPFTIAVMLVICIGLYVTFKRRHWL